MKFAKQRGDLGQGGNGGMLQVRRLALAVAKPKMTATDVKNTLSKLISYCGEDAADCLVGEGLASLWCHSIATTNAEAAIPAEFFEALRAARIADAALYLAQKSALLEIDRLFEANNIVYAAFKGAQVREAVYQPVGLNAALRSANDIDILIHSEQLEAAARALIAAGYRMRVDPNTLSHEASFVREPVVIDLHWDLLRPGRTRAPICKRILADRQRIGWFWGVSDTDAIFIMLVHPAFVRYACNLALCSIVDFILYTRGRHVDWDAVAVRLEETGLKTAAWTMLKWFAFVAGECLVSVPGQFVGQMRPGKLRASYLSIWLNHSLPVRWWNARLAIQFGFTLFLHDRLSDAAHAVSSILSARRNGRNDSWVRDMYACLQREP